MRIQKVSNNEKNEGCDVQTFKSTHEKLKSESIETNVVSYKRLEFVSVEDSGENNYEIVFTYDDEIKWLIHVLNNMLDEYLIYKK